MGRPWTTPEQHAWLYSRIPEFLQAQRDAKTARFHQLTSEAWFQTWPELVEAEAPIRKSAVAKRKTQLQQWFFWNSHPVKRSRNVKPFTSFNMRKGARGRLPQRVEAYQKLYNAKVAPKITEALKEAGEINSNTRLSIIRDIPAKMFAQEPPEVHAAVDAYILAEKEKRDQRIREKDLDVGDINNRAPHKFNEAIQEFPSVVNDFLKSAADATGWVIHLIAAGPDPAANGEISSIEQYFGPTSVAGNTFQEAHAGYTQHVEGPFLSHVQGIFPPDVCRKRSLQDAEFMHTGGIQETQHEPNAQLPHLDIHSLIPLSSNEVDKLVSNDGPGFPACDSVGSTYDDSSMDMLFQKLDSQFGRFSDEETSTISSATQITSHLISERTLVPASTASTCPPSPPLASHPLSIGAMHLTEILHSPITNYVASGDLASQLQEILDVDLPPLNASPPSYLTASDAHQCNVIAETNLDPIPSHQGQTTPPESSAYDVTGVPDYTIHPTENVLSQDQLSPSSEVPRQALRVTKSKRKEATRKREETMARNKAEAGAVKRKAPAQKVSKKKQNLLPTTGTTPTSSRPRRIIKPPTRADHSPSPPPQGTKSGR